MRSATHAAQASAAPALALAVPATLTPRKAAPVNLAPAMHPAQAFAAIARSCLYQLSANAPGALTAQDPEFIHLMRVALRRLRSAVKLFKEHLPAGFIERINPELRLLAGLLGEVRDWDVLLGQTLPRVLRATPDARAGSIERTLQAAIHPLREAQLTRLRRGLRARRYRVLIHDLAEIIAQLEGPKAALTRDCVDLAGFAAHHLKRASRKLRMPAASLEQMQSEERHQVRIAAKRLRYAVEAFVSLYTGKAARRYAEQLAQLQDALGILNDHAVALQRLATLDLPAATRSKVQRQLQTHEAPHLDDALTAYRALRKSRKFWKQG